MKTNQLPPMPSHDEHFMTCAHVYTTPPAPQPAPVDERIEEAFPPPTPIDSEELDAWVCDHCNGGGWHWQEHQVGERKTDVQQLKTHCDKCEGLGYCGPDAEARAALQSPQPAAPVVSEDDLVACLISSGCVGTVKMSFESGPMDITRPSLNATKFARAILALRPERVPMTEDQVWHNDALMSANGIAGFKMDALLRIVRAAEAHHGISAQAKKEKP